MAASKIYIETYGCASNRADSQAMAGLLKQAGYEIVSDRSNADYMLVNSCAVKSTTEEKIIHELRELSKAGKKIIVAGCLTKVNPERIRKAVPDFAAMLEPRSVHKIAEALNEIENGSENVVKESELPEQKPALPRFSFSKVVDVIKLSEGCLSSCSFCATKLARGSLYSYRPDAIRDAVKRGLHEGHKEFHLASEDSSAYGRDIGTNLPELISSITRMDGNFFVRVGMMNPLHFRKVEIGEIIEAYKNEKVFKFLHLCVQSGSNSVLRIMKRGYDAEDFVYYIERFREEIPDITLWTDIIVGHPGETEEDFQTTLELLEKTEPDVTNISAYGVRSGTLSAKMKQLTTEVKKERTQTISKLVDKIRLERNEKWIGWQGKALIDEFKKGNFIARNYAYKPIAIKGDFELGQMIDVKIVGAEKTCLIGESG